VTFALPRSGSRSAAALALLPLALLPLALDAQVRPPAATHVRT